VLPPMGTLSCWAAAVIFAPVTTGFRRPAYQVDTLRVIGNRREPKAVRVRPRSIPRAIARKCGDIFRRHFQLSCAIARLSPI
jgi:hypothetical protein